MNYDKTHVRWAVENEESDRGSIGLGDTVLACNPQREKQLDIGRYSGVIDGKHHVAFWHPMTSYEITAIPVDAVYAKVIWQRAYGADIMEDEECDDAAVSRWLDSANDKMIAKMAKAIDVDDECDDIAESDALELLVGQLTDVVGQLAEIVEKVMKRVEAVDGGLKNEPISD